MVKNPPANAGNVRDAGLIPGLEDPLEKEMATHSRILAWRIPWTEELSRVRSPWGHNVLDTTERLSNNKILHIGMTWSTHRNII